MQPLVTASIIRVDGQHAAQWQTLRRQCLAENPIMWHVGCKVDMDRTDVGYVQLLHKHHSNPEVLMMGFLANTELQGQGFIYRRAEEQDWLLGGLYVAPRFRGRWDALGDKSAVSHMYETAIDYVQQREPNATITAQIRFGNIPSIVAAQRHGFVHTTTERGVPNMAGGVGDVLTFQRKLGS